LSGNLERITKLLARRGLCSRREAEEFLCRGWIQVNGETVTQPGSKALEMDQITLTRNARDILSQKQTLLLNKPPGIVSAQAEDGYLPAARLLTRKNHIGPVPWRKVATDLAAAGRLDIDSRGLLVLTNNGVVAKTLISPNSRIEKEYIVTYTGKISEKKLIRLGHGLSLDGRTLRPAKVHSIGRSTLCFVLQEGRKRQIRRMCEMLELRVISLCRTRIGNIELADLPPGKWRFMAGDEAF